MTRRRAQDDQVLARQVGWRRDGLDLQSGLHGGGQQGGSMLFAIADGDSAGSGMAQGGQQAPQIVDAIRQQVIDVRKQDQIEGRWLKPGIAGGYATGQHVSQTFVATAQGQRRQRRIVDIGGQHMTRRTHRRCEVTRQIPAAAADFRHLIARAQGQRRQQDLRPPIGILGRRGRRRRRGRGSLAATSRQSNPRQHGQQQTPIHARTVSRISEPGGGRSACRQRRSLALVCAQSIVLLLVPLLVPLLVLLLVLSVVLSVVPSVAQNTQSGPQEKFWPRV